MNGVNLEAFPFEYDLTWMSFFQDAEGRTYCRYAGRTDEGPESHLNQESLVRTMHEVLKLHADHSVQKPSRYEPVATGSKLPTDIPPVKEMIGRRKESCIHCHDVKVAELRHKHELGQLQKEMVYTYPNPGQLGVLVDARRQNRIAKVVIDSAAEQAGIQTGDRLLEADGQRILTYADLTRVLELTPEQGTLELTVERDDSRLKKSIELQPGWRVSKDPSWRASLHVVGPGAGFWGRPANAKERKKLDLPADKLALKVTFIWASHAKAAKVKLGDIIIDLDGHRADMNMRQFHGYLQVHRNWGDTIRLEALREGNPIELTMNLPEGTTQRLRVLQLFMPPVKKYRRFAEARPCDGRVKVQSPFR